MKLSPSYKYGSAAGAELVVWLVGKAFRFNCKQIVKGLTQVNWQTIES